MFTKYKWAQLLFVILLISYYHFTIQNGLEKIFCETYVDYNLVKRPLAKCADGSNGQNTMCIGMPSGHAETVTIFATLLHLHNYISLPICVFLIVLFSAQRVIAGMHSLIQVIIGISVGLLYVTLYTKFSFIYAFLMVFSIGVLLATLSVYKLDKQIREANIPYWVEDRNSIQQKQNVPYYSKLWSIYANAVIQNRTFMSWTQVEKSLDSIIERISHSGKYYDAVIGIKTGGAVLSDYVSQKLGIPNYKVKLSRSEYQCNKQPHNTVNDLIQKRVLQNYGQYTICEPIDADLNGKNVILIDELVSSGKTMEETYRYLKNVKGINDVYIACIALEDGYKGNLRIHHVINGAVLIWPWGYDN